ncbi:hypothetical protein IWQ62_001573 [Dispira parvispora]|uniref:Uncharacterized protein n=1 Tax=Dispira parvispora TaxID=1520584 RepID=A0A9W8AS87_9FUNG|nr:hypothetical protein IWQ62_001573 [Dispira parvispora]
MESPTWSINLVDWTFGLILLVLLWKTGGKLQRKYFIPWHLSRTDGIGVYFTVTRHCRLRPVHHQFTYPLFYLSVPLDRLDVTSRRYQCKPKPWWETWRLVTFDQWGLFSLWSKDCLVGKPFLPVQPNRSVAQNVRRRLRHRGYCTRGLIRMIYVATPRVLGYGFNPLSMYFCYESYPGRIIRTFSNPRSEPNGMTLRYLVLEVRNTFGEGDMYVLDYQQSTGKPTHVATHDIPRRFHVSPFNNRLGYYRFVTLRKPRQKLWIRVNIYNTLPNDPRSPVASTDEIESSPKFWASINGTGYRLDGWSLGQLMLVYPLTGFFTVPRILWQAAQLAYRHHLPIFVKPDPLDGTLTIQPPDRFEYYTAILFLSLLRTLIDHGKGDYIFRVWFPGMMDSPVELVKLGVEYGAKKVIQMGFRNYSVCTRLFAGENDPWVVLLVGFVEGQWWCDKREEFLVAVADYAKKLTEDDYTACSGGQLVGKSVKRWLGVFGQHWNNGVINGLGRWCVDLRYVCPLERTSQMVANIWSKLLITSPHQSSLWLVTHEELYRALQTKWQSLVKHNPRGHLIRLHYVSIKGQTDATNGISPSRYPKELTTLLASYDGVYWLTFLSSDIWRDPLPRWCFSEATHIHPILVCPYQKSHFSHQFVDSCTQVTLVKCEQLYRRALSSVFSPGVLQGLPRLWQNSPRGHDITPDQRHRYHRHQIWKYYAIYVLNYRLYRLMVNPAPDTRAYCGWNWVLQEWSQLLEINVGLKHPQALLATADSHSGSLQQESSPNSTARMSLLTEYYATLPLFGHTSV